MNQFSSAELAQIKQQALYLCKQHEVAMLLDNNGCDNAFGLRHIEFAAAWGAKYSLSADKNGLAELQAFIEQHPNEYVFVQLAYDIKNDLEALHSHHPDEIEFPHLFAFVPEQLLVINAEGECVIGKEHADFLLAQKLNEGSIPNAVNVLPRVTQQQYLEDIAKIRRHIVLGDVYELNYCMEFFNDDAKLDAYSTYERLKQKSPVPFAAFYKLGERFLMCASPERFLTRKNGRVYSQPIKGTAKRLLHKEEDEQQKANLLNSEKERAENLMIVDLVRNDLAKTAQTGGVQVDELFGIYSFQQVHQMISTVSATPKATVNSTQIIEGAFPMGSMTGTPKIMAMQLIEQYELTKRGLYSGSVGYFAPNGIFDLNVVIRSLQYNAAKRYVNFEVGGAITYDSVAEEEYKECLLKASAMMEVLKGNC